MSHNYDVGMKPVKIVQVDRKLAEDELKRHLLYKPLSSQIQARTLWAQKKDLLETQLKLSKK